jgi:hypothetical protein
MIIPSAIDARPPAPWPLASTSPTLGALTTAPGTARAHVEAVLAEWGLANLADIGILIVSELVTNGVRASTGSNGGLVYVDGRMPTIRLCLLSDGSRPLIECHDQAFGEPVRKTVSASAESGRGLAMIDRLTGGRWGWYAGERQPGKCVWAVLPAENA